MNRDDEVAPLRQLRRTTATSSAAIRRTRRCRACTPPRDTPRRGSAAPSPSSASTSRDPEGTPPHRRAIPAPGRASTGIRARAVRSRSSSDSTLQYSRAMSTAAILTIGNELTSGDVADTNGVWLAKRLERIGVSVTILAAVPDEIDAVARFVRREAPEADIVLVTGGLGGTPDDLTREALAAAFEVEQETVPALADALRARFTRDPEYAARWAALPVGSRGLENPLGGAPGFVIENVYVLPGLPAEMRGDVRHDRGRARRPGRRSTPGAGPTASARARSSTCSSRRESASPDSSWARTRRSATPARTSRSSSSRATRSSWRRLWTTSRPHLILSNAKYRLTDHDGSPQGPPRLADPRRRSVPAPLTATRSSRS